VENNPGGSDFCSKVNCPKSRQGINVPTQNRTGEILECIGRILFFKNECMGLQSEDLVFGAVDNLGI
jgi:hypothetical protein